MNLGEPSRDRRERILVSAHTSPVLFDVRPRALYSCYFTPLGCVLQLFQYSGSAADVASYVGHEEAKKVNGPGSAPGQNAVPGAAYTPSNDDCIQQNGTRGKGKGKAKGKSKAAEPLPTEDVEEFEDGDEMVETQETEEMSVDAAEVEEGRLNGDSKSSGGEVDHDHESSAGSAAGVKRPAKKDGHAMLKSRLTNVSLRGLVAMDDGAVMVRSLIWTYKLTAGGIVTRCFSSWAGCLALRDAEISCIRLKSYPILPRDTLRPPRKVSSPYTSSLPHPR